MILSKMMPFYLNYLLWFLTVSLMEQPSLEPNLQLLLQTPSNHQVFLHFLAKVLRKPAKNTFLFIRFSGPNPHLKLFICLSHFRPPAPSPEASENDGKTDSFRWGKASRKWALSSLSKTWANHQVFQNHHLWQTGISRLSEVLWQTGNFGFSKVNVKLHVILTKWNYV